MRLLALPKLSSLSTVPALPGVPRVHRALSVLPPIHREPRLALEAAALRSSTVWRTAGGLDGQGCPVLLIPGFLAGDGSLGTLTRWLRAGGYRTKRAGIRANVACSEMDCRRLEERLEALVAASGHPRAVVIGQSRGGILARVLATRRPDLVAGVVTLGAPVRDMLAVHPLLLAQIGLLGILGTSRIPGLLSYSCWRGACCAPFREDIARPVPKQVGYVALYSRSDGVVDWRSCLAEDAELIEVDASHCGMSLNPQAYRAVAGALSRFAVTG